MEKPKIVSVTDALESPLDESDVPQLPGLMPSSPAPQVPAVPLPEFEEHPEEVPPERVVRMIAPESSTTPVASVPQSLPPETTVTPVSEPAIIEPPASAPEFPQITPAPSGVPPWVERNPPQPTVAEMVGPVPTYPGVGRPRINSITQAVVSLEPAKPVTAPIRPVPAAIPASVRPSAPSAPAVLVPASSGKLYERPELDADHFAEDMASHKPAPAASGTPSAGTVPSPLSSQPASTVVQEYRSIAAADLRPPAAPARPRTPEEERAHAKNLAAQIHQENQNAGLFGKVKRLFGLR